MLTLRKRSVEKRNSRGGIVRKEEVVTLTKKVHASTKAQKKKLQRPPTAFPSDTIPNPKFSLSPIPNKDTNKNPKFSLSPIPNLDTNRNPKVSLSPIPNKVLPLSKFEREIPPREGYLFSEKMNLPKTGSGMQDYNRQNNEVIAGRQLLEFKIHNEGGKFNGNTKYSATNSDADYAEDTNSEESEVEDLSSEESEAGDTNFDESEAEDINSGKSEAGGDMSSEESEAEDINSEESEVEHINSEESSEAEDLDDDPPRYITNNNQILGNLASKRYLTNINRGMYNLSMRR